MVDGRRGESADFRACHRAVLDASHKISGILIQAVVGFLLGIAIGLCIGLYWRRVMARNWGFYRKFYGEATGANARLRMAPKKLRLEWPTYLLSVVMGVVLFRMVVEGVSWLAGSIFFGFAAGSALGLVLILRELL